MVADSSMDEVNPDLGLPVPSTATSACVPGVCWVAGYPLRRSLSLAARSQLEARRPMKFLFPTMLSSCSRSSCSKVYPPSRWRDNSLHKLYKNLHNNLPDLKEDQRQKNHRTAPVQTTFHVSFGSLTPSNPSRGDPPVDPARGPCRGPPENCLRLLRLVLPSSPELLPLGSPPPSLLRRSLSSLSPLRVRRPRQRARTGSPEGGGGPRRRRHQAAWVSLERRKRT